MFENLGRSTEFEVLSVPQNTSINSVCISCADDFKNDVQLLPIGLFNKLSQKKIKTSNFTLIQCISFEKLLGHEFNDGENLKVVTVKKTSLQFIHEASFKNLEKVYELNLSWNKIEILSENLFKTMKELSSLDLSNNKIRCLSENLLRHNIKKLKGVYFDANRIEFIGTSQFIGSNIKNAYFEKNICLNQNHINTGTFKFENFIFNFSKKCNVKEACRLEEPSTSFEYFYVVVIACCLLYLLIDVTMAAIVITKHIRSFQDENECYIYKEIHFYDAPKLIFSKYNKK